MKTLVFKRPHLFISILSISFSLFSYSSVYNLESTHNGSLRKLSLNIPDSLSQDTIRAILIHGNGANGDQTNLANNAELIAFAEHYGLAILATGFWGRFNDYNDAELELFESMITEFSELSSHSELVHAPWLPTGHSNGGQMSYGLNTKRPEKTIGFITGSGGYYNNTKPSANSLRTPGMIICGELDRDYRVEANQLLFERNRPRGALWAWTEQEGSGHEEGEMRHLKLAFLEECLRLRYPNNQTPRNGPVTLKQLDEYEGWLVNQNTWNNGNLVEITPHSGLVGNPYQLGWVPTERIARIYQAYSTYGKAADHSNVQHAGSPIEKGESYFYEPTLNVTDWTKIEYFLDGKKIEEYEQQDESIRLAIQLNEGGFHVVYGIVTLNNGSQRSTAIRTFFQKGDKRKNELQSWFEKNKPQEINIIDPTIDINQFLDSEGNFTLVESTYPTQMTNVRLEQDINGKNRYCFDITGTNEEPQDGFLYRLTYQFNLSDNFNPDQLEKTLPVRLIQSIGGPAFEITPQSTFEGL